MNADLNEISLSDRAKIIRGLVQIAAAESPPVPPMQGQDPGPTPEQSARRLERALDDLLKCLLDLLSHKLERLPEAPVKLPSGIVRHRNEIISQVYLARDHIQKLTHQLHPGSSVSEIDSIVKQARGPLIEIVEEWFPIPKIFVAVHGIGDQFQNETVQTVAFRVCDYVGQPTAIPLGRFHSPGARVGVFLPEPGRDPMLDCGFAEIYWADVPRIPAAEKHTLEEPRKWARTLIQRLRLKSLGSATLDPADKASDLRVEELLEESIQGVSVADQVCALAEKAGLFKFDLKKVLNDFLNDVQVVTEFEDYREQLLEIFDTVMTRISIYFPSAKIYVVAHSEGTVVSFMGLLRGMDQNREWVNRVAGYMTIGSPLNKHVYFWPELFNQFKAAHADPARQQSPIPWKNYYDYGDPIGYDLEPTRKWLKKKDWAPFFEFAKKDDTGFTRYYFPGAAHNDYWRDPDVFGHFIQTVVDPPDQNGQVAILKARRKEPFDEPESSFFARLVSYPMPYGLASALLFVACFVLYKAIRGCLDPIGARFESPPDMLRDVTALWGLIAGMSLIARIPRLGESAYWSFVANVIGVGLTLFYFAVSQDNAGSIERFLDGSKGLFQWEARNTWLLGAIVVVSLTAWGLRALRPVAWTLVPVAIWILILRLAFAAEPLSTASSSLASLTRYIVPVITCFLVPAFVLFGAPWLLSKVKKAPIADGSDSDTTRPSKPKNRGAAKILASVEAAACMLAAVALWLGILFSLNAIGRTDLGQLSLKGLAVISVAWAVGLRASAVSWHYPGIGTRPLIHTGGLVILLVVATQLIFHPPAASSTADRVLVAKAAHRITAEIVRRQIPNLKNVAIRPEAGRDPVADITTNKPISEADWPLIVDAAALNKVADVSLDHGEIWPVFVAAPAFLYVWWLAVIAFDLTFIWHLYIRHASQNTQKLIEARLNPVQATTTTTVKAPTPAAADHPAG